MQKEIFNYILLIRVIFFYTHQPMKNQNKNQTSNSFQGPYQGPYKFSTKFSSRFSLSGAAPVNVIHLNVLLQLKKKTRQRRRIQFKLGIQPTHHYPRTYNRPRFIDDYPLQCPRCGVTFSNSRAFDEHIEECELDYDD